jgi:hypothetical protein
MRSEHVDLIRASIQDNSFCLLENFLGPDVAISWPNVINALNDASHQDPDFHVNDPFVETQINKVIRRGAGYFYGFLDDSDVHVQPLIEPVIQELGEYGLDFFGSIVFMNLFTQDDYAHPHKDAPSSSIYIQCEGSTTWRFYSDPDIGSCIETLHLNAGDAVFFTGNVYHSVVANTPRASIVLRMPLEAQ